MEDVREEDSNKHLIKIIMSNYFSTAITFCSVNTLRQIPYSIGFKFLFHINACKQKQFTTQSKLEWLLTCRPEHKICKYVREWHHTQDLLVLVDHYEPVDLRFDNDLHDMEERVCDLAHVNTFKPLVAVLIGFLQCDI